MAKIVKLGEKASFFYDPTTNLQVSKGEVLTLTKKQEYSKKIRKALQGGHLVLTNEAELKAYQNGEDISATNDEDNNNWVEDFDLTNDKAISKLNKTQLIALIEHVSDDDYEEDYLAGLSKAELISELEEIIN